MWFDRWENLEQVEVDGHWSDEPPHAPVRIQAYAHLGRNEQGNIMGLGACEKFHVPNVARRARQRCPECKHGGALGHKGRSCLGLVTYHSFEGVEYETCGCRHDGREKQQTGRLTRSLNRLSRYARILT